MKEFIDKLIEELEGVKSIVNSPADIVWNNAVKMCIYKVNELSEEYKVSEMPTGWISVSEGLPKYTDEYNVTVDVASEFGCYRTVKTLRFERIEGKEPKWVIPQDEVYRVIAWMPLPAPYTEGE